tara:strand:- start:82 stop:537 length:456 start_codon:yes stop_codon:yes gene_type:complete
MNKIFIKFLVILIFISGCGYTPIFSNKNSSFSIKEISSVGDNKLNRIINNKLNNYKGSDGEKIISLSIATNLDREVSSKDTKGNPKTYKIMISSKILVKDTAGNINEKLFSKSVNYNNRNNKFELRKFENETAKNITEKISEEIIIYLQSI